jgi:hypothetical protein
MRKFWMMLGEIVFDVLQIFGCGGRPPDAH